MTFRLLCSFHYFRNADMAALIDQLRADYGGPVELFADSGAFSAATLNTTIRLPEYTAWLRDWQPLITTAATLDVIGDPDATARNTTTLEEAGLSVLPTFHVGTPWPVLEALCARHRYLALGGMVPHANTPAPVMRWLVGAFKIAAEHGTVFHGFGQTTQRVTAALPFFSVDSSTWSAAARYGRLSLWDPHTLKIKAVKPREPDNVNRHAGLLRAHGLDPLTIIRPGFAQRAMRDPDTYNAEQHMLTGVSAHAWQRYAAWLQDRHHVPPPPGRQTTGTLLYLADAHVPNLRHAARYLNARKEATT